MITFKSRNSAIRNADLITRTAHNIYPHISTSKVQKSVNENEVKKFFFTDLSYKLGFRILKTRSKMEEKEKNLFEEIINALKFSKIGNCSEEAKLAELIGKINGQKNIYSGGIYIKDKLSTHSIDHEITFITDKKITNNTLYQFSDKEAIIIDPWLGITDFAENYFNRLKNEFFEVFPEIQNKSSALKKRKSTKRKQCKPNSKFRILPDITNPLTKYKFNKIKKLYPELKIENYKKVEL